jgi:large subunit ribosomal protein L25
MANSFELAAQVRTDAGKGASRRLRRMNLVPGILYGGGQEPQRLQFAANALKKHLEHEAFYSQVLTVDVDGVSHKAVLKAVQHHPVRPGVLHIDLQRVSDDDRIRMQVPLHFINEETCVGVKKGGQVMHNMTDVEVTCRARDLPQYIEVDMAAVEVGQAVHLSELDLPAGVEIPSISLGPDHDFPVVSVHGVASLAAAAESEPGEPT